MVHLCLFNDTFIHLISPYNNQHAGTELDTLLLCHGIGTYDDNSFFHIIAVQTLRHSHGNNAYFTVDHSVSVVIENLAV